MSAETLIAQELNWSRERAAALNQLEKQEPNRSARKALEAMSLAATAAAHAYESVWSELPTFRETTDPRVVDLLRKRMKLHADGLAIVAKRGRLMFQLSNDQTRFADAEAIFERIAGGESIVTQLLELPKE